MDSLSKKIIHFEVTNKANDSLEFDSEISFKNWSLLLNGFSLNFKDPIQRWFSRPLIPTKSSRKNLKALWVRIFLWVVIKSGFIPYLISK